jgi:AcrR family transcriptional regulator
MKRTNNKRDLILDAMQDMLTDSGSESVSVSDIARRAGIGKGSIYYYFKSKEDILDAVIERFLQDTIERCARAGESGQDVFGKLESVYSACREFSLDSQPLEEAGFLRAQHSAWMHQKYVAVLIRLLKPILADILRQGVGEGKIACEHPCALSELCILVLAVKLRNQILPVEKEEIASFLMMFRDLLQRGLAIEPGALSFITI